MRKTNVQQKNESDFLGPGEASGREWAKVEQGEDEAEQKNASKNTRFFVSDVGQKRQDKKPGFRPSGERQFWGHRRADEHFKCTN